MTGSVMNRHQFRTGFDGEQLQAIKAQLVRRAMSGQHLSNWLPGGDYKGAISALVSQHGGGSLVVDDVDDRLSSQTHPKGIGAYEDFGDAMRDKNRVAWMSWQEVVDVLAAGVSTHRMAELERTATDWAQWHHEHRDDWRTSHRELGEAERQELIDARYHSWRAVDRSYEEARKAIIEAAIDAQSPELTLF